MRVGLRFENNVQMHCEFLTFPSAFAEYIRPKSVYGREF
jgi:hypothetical protein